MKYHIRLLVTAITIVATVNTVQAYQSTLGYLDQRLAHYNDPDLEQVRQAIINTNVDMALNSLHSQGGSLSDAVNECEQRAMQSKQAMETDKNGYLSTHNGGESVIEQINNDGGDASLASDPWLKAYIKDRWFQIAATELEKQLQASGG